MEKFNRSVRRHHNKRLKKKREIFWYRNKNFMTPKRLGQVLHTPCNCSCTMCGNPRKKLNVKYSIKELSMFQKGLQE